MDGAGPGREPTLADLIGQLTGDLAALVRKEAQLARAEFGEKVVGRWESMIRESGVKPVPYLAKPGQILVWHENLMHAGSVRRDPSLSRRSVVTHHFADGALAYYDSSGMAGILAEPTA